jgi:hypothetical protein
MDQDDRDDTMLEERLAGRSVVVIAKQYRCATSDVDAVIDRRLNYDLNNDLRLKAIKLDTARLEALMAPFFERATKDRDVQAGTLCVKILERRALLLGLDHPTQSRVDVYQIEAQQAPSQHDRICEAIMRLVEQAPPAQRALRKRLEELSPEKALEMLGPPQSNGGDGVPAVPDATNRGSDPQ